MTVMASTVVAADWNETQRRELYRGERYRSKKATMWYKVLLVTGRAGYLHVLGYVPLHKYIELCCGYPLGLCVQPRWPLRH